MLLFTVTLPVLGTTDTWQTQAQYVPERNITETPWPETGIVSVAEASEAGDTRVCHPDTGGYMSRVSADPRPPNSRLGPSGVLNRDRPRTITVSSGTFSDTDRGRGDVSIGLTRYMSVFGQPHDLKFGVEYETTTSTDTAGLAGGQFIFAQDGEPVGGTLWDGDVDEATSRRGTAYVRDRWSFNDRVTLNLGVRLDLNRASVPVRGTIFSTNPVSPRAGVAWAVTADHATVVRAHYGRYYDSILTRRIADMDTSNQNPVISFKLLPSGDFLEIARRLDAENTTIDDGLRHSYVDQYVVGIERELVADVSVQAQYVRRNFDQFMGVINTNTTWTARQVRDKGPDGRPGTADDGEMFTVFRPSNRGEESYLYTNPEGAFRRYDAIQLIGTKRYAHNWQMQASYTWSRSEATVGNLFGTNAGLKDLKDLSGGLFPGVFSSPNGAINAEGVAPLDVSELKILGTYRVPVWGGFNVSGVYRYHSGNTWARFFRSGGFSIRAEPRGSRRLPSIASLDLRVEKTWGGLGARGTFGLFVDLFNVTNEGAATSVLSESGPSLGEPLSWTDPRTIRAGLRYVF